MSLEGKTALVTGASGTLGRAFAKVLANDGARVAVGYLNNKEGALETATEIASAYVVRVDVTDSEGVASAFDEVTHQLGPVQILVNNAGVTRDRPLARLTDAQWSEVIGTNLGGAFKCARQALPKMLGLGWGRIVNVGSVVGLAGNAGQSNYSASKAGLVGLTKSLSQEVARYGVTVNLLAPGFVESDLTAAVSEPSRTKLIERVPMKRAGEPAEIADALRFCVNNDYLTGQVIAIDGGLT